MIAVLRNKAQAIREAEAAKYAEAVLVLRELYREYDNHPCPDYGYRRILWEQAGRVLAELDQEAKG